ncbi:hypothetical protein [Streptomyces scabiei]|uniref:hypothetical protein n=1 Tax=Streptomyces scabiei TaxID=1930 RepID=UPI000B1AC813|nr:hypothetical protein [Streptomyces scabiei]MDX2539905.1 hypothetical protein [Streptomyces scabiei]MDX2802029.1 hypothetical protein [Streptomyces scabiei]MDX3200282.1 hypothetical protein [Streptomyces scabiei]MDX3223947.1 hypothetical protein [Streptomyces scabiei]MDX3830245.1 hypothetical protein [Streptomyces scabiei]
MSEDRPVVSAEIPEFTGNLEQLETDAGDIAFDGMAVGAAGLLIDANFHLLQPFYKAPEADQLFATTAPVAAAGHDLQTELSTVSKALLDYAAEVRPLVARLDALRAEAAAFERRVADDEDWVADGDLIDENTARRNAVNAAWTAFQAAERACHNKIVALVGGEPLAVGDGTDKKNTYGYRAEDLDNAGGLPWGDPVEESNPWYYIHEHAWDFTVGFVVDGVWGTIKGLGTLVGVNGWDAAGQAWVGLGKLATGILITGTPLGAAYWLTPADKLPSWLRDSRTAVVETGKALIAYDEWGKNPSRAAGAVTFNVLTTVFTGGAGGAAAATGKAGAVARAISFAGKAGRIVDPMTYIAKGIGGTAVKIGDVMASLRGITDGTHIRLGEGTYRIADTPNIADDLPAGLTPDNSVRMTTPEGQVVYLDTKTLLMHNADGTIRESLENLRHEPTAEQRAGESGTSRADGEREPVGAGVGTRAGETVAAGGRGGDAGATGPGGRTTGDAPSGRGGGSGRAGGGPDSLGRGDDGPGRAGDDPPDGHSDADRGSHRSPDPDAGTHEPDESAGAHGADADPPVNRQDNDPYAGMEPDLTRPALPPGDGPLTLRDVRNMRNPELRWAAGEDLHRQQWRGGPERHYPVPVQAEGRYPVTGSGGRKVDVPVDLPDGRTVAVEVKTYGEYRTLTLKDGTKETIRNEVPLSKGIKEQIHKDLALREMNPGYDPRWSFTHAGPSKELRDYLTEVKIIFLEYGPAPKKG